MHAQSKASFYYIFTSSWQAKMFQFKVDTALFYSNSSFVSQAPHQR
jgi:hypothetical protein